MAAIQDGVIQFELKYEPSKLYLRRNKVGLTHRTTP